MKRNFKIRVDGNKRTRYYMDGSEVEPEFFNANLIGDLGMNIGSAQGSTVVVDPVVGTHVAIHLTVRDEASRLLDVIPVSFFYCSDDAGHVEILGAPGFSTPVTTGHTVNGLFDTTPDNSGGALNPWVGRLAFLFPDGVLVSSQFSLPNA